jgi:hypothetical protein
MEQDLRDLRATEEFITLLEIPPVVSFGLGTITYHLHLSDSSSHDELNLWYDGFTTAQRTNPIRIAYLGKKDLAPELFTRLIEEAELYRNIQVITSHHLLEKDEMAILRWDFRALINKRSRICRVFLINPVAGSIDAIARVAGALLYPENDSFLIHGSSILHNGKGYLFTGVSGSGKSTIAGLSGAKVLNDEISLVSIDQGGRVFVQGTPFYGDLKKGENTRTLLSGLYLIKQDERSFIEEIDPLRQQLSLLRNVVYFQTDLKSFDGIHRLIEKTLVSRPLQILHFRNDNSFMEVLP